MSQPNTVSDDFGTIGGGLNNTVGNTNLDVTDVRAGTIAGGTVAGYFGQHYGWRSGFYLFGSLGVILGIVLIALLREPARGQAVLALKMKDQHAQAKQSSDDGAGQQQKQLGHDFVLVQARQRSPGISEHGRDGCERIHALSQCTTLAAHFNSKFRHPSGCCAGKGNEGNGIRGELEVAESRSGLRWARASFTVRGWIPLPAFPCQFCVVNEPTVTGARRLQ